MGSAVATRDAVAAKEDVTGFVCNRLFSTVEAENWNVLTVAPRVVHLSCYPDEPRADRFEQDV